MFGNTLLSMLIPTLGAIISIGFIYGSFSQRIKSLEKDVNSQRVHNDTIVEVKTKLDLIINHFLNNKS